MITEIKNLLYIKKSLVGSLFAPNYVSHTNTIDKTSFEAKNNPKEYFNKYLIFYACYSSVIYIFIITGIVLFYKNIIYAKRINSYDKFLIFNLLSAAYFMLISGLWGNPKYFIPCILNFSFFISMGFNFLMKNSLIKKKIN